MKAELTGVIGFGSAELLGRIVRRLTKQFHRDSSVPVRRQKRPGIVTYFVVDREESTQELVYSRGFTTMKPSVFDFDDASRCPISARPAKGGWKFEFIAPLIEDSRTES
jgi:hypothetical protein